MGRIVFNLNFTASQPPKNLTPERKAEYIARRKFYNLTAEYNYFTYTLADKKVGENATAADYFTKSTGLFNQHGKIDGEQFEKLKEQLRDTESIIWHGVFSFDAETSAQFETDDAAIEFLRQNFGALIDRTSLDKENIELYASLHKDTDNRHIHFAFFEREPKHLDAKGNKCYTKKGNFGKGALTDFLIASNLKLSKENSNAFWQARNATMERLKLLRGNGKYENEVKKKLCALANDLPKTGRLQYKSENMAELRPRIDEITELVLHSDKAAYEQHKQVLQTISARERDARQICLANSFAIIDGQKVKAEKLKIAEGFYYVDAKTGEKKPLTVDDKAWGKLTVIEDLRKDYYARLGNKIIGMAFDIRKAEKAAAKKRGRGSEYNDKQYKAQRRASRTSITRTVRRGIRQIPMEHARESNEYFYRLKEIEREQEIEKQNAKVSS